MKNKTIQTKKNKWDVLWLQFYVLNLSLDIVHKTIVSIISFFAQWNFSAGLIWSNVKPQHLAVKLYRSHFSHFTMHLIPPLTFCCCYLPQLAVNDQSPSNFFWKNHLFYKRFLLGLYWATVFHSSLLVATHVTPFPAAAAEADGK